MQAAGYSGTPLTKKPAFLKIKQIAVHATSGTGDLPGKEVFSASGFHG